jgi:hypothetical protein
MAAIDFLSASDAAVERQSGWLILGGAAQGFAIRSDCVLRVFRSTDAQRLVIGETAAQIRLQGGRPWFVVPLEQLFPTLGPGMFEEHPEWTVVFSHVDGLAVEVSAVEGPYRGVVLNQQLSCREGQWPVFTPQLGQSR